MKKKISMFLVIGVLSFSNFIPILGSDSKDLANESYINLLNLDIDLKENEGFEIISLEDLPDGIIPYQVKSNSDLENIISEIRTNINVMENANSELLINSELRATDHHKQIATYKAGLGTVSLNSYVDYEDEKITRVEPYTSFTGFTYSFTWDERKCYGTISSNKSEAYVYASGDLEYYFLVNTELTKFYARNIDLSGRIYFK